MTSQNFHWAIVGTDLSVDKGFIQEVLTNNAPAPLDFLKGKKGALYSNYTLARFINEEALHDDFTLSENERRSIRTFSSGEQRKALLAHLLASQPDFLVLDNAFDMLDKASQEALKNRVIELSKDLIILQILRRKNTLLPFIDKVIRLQKNTVLFQGSLKNYFIQFPKQEFEMNGSIPRALSKQTKIPAPFIQFKNVSATYGNRTILNAINWKIQQGDFWQLKGPNGSGKTTLLSMLTGDNTKAYGQNITLFGRRKGTGESIWEIKKQIGYVTPAMTTLFKHRQTTVNMIISGLYDSLGMYHKPTFTEKKLAEKWCELIGVAALKNSWFSVLTEGQQCMVLIARAMIKHPPLLILDEPTHGLDDYNVAVLTALVNKIANESHTTIIYVSHRQEKGLEPQKVFELVPGKIGSEGYVRNK